MKHSVEGITGLLRYFLQIGRGRQRAGGIDKSVVQQTPVFDRIIENEVAAPEMLRAPSESKSIKSNPKFESFSKQFIKLLLEADHDLSKGPLITLTQENDELVLKFSDTITKENFDVFEQCVKEFSDISDKNPILRCLNSYIERGTGILESDSKNMKYLLTLVFIDFEKALGKDSILSGIKKTPEYTTRFGISEVELEDAFLNCDFLYSLAQLDSREPLRAQYALFVILQQKEDAILSQCQKLIDTNQRQGLLDFLNGISESGGDKYVVEKLRLQAEVWLEMESIKKLSTFPFNDIWRFFIDEDKEKYGAYIFENEPGYIAGCMRGFLKCLKDRNNDKNINWYSELHSEVTENVYNYFPKTGFSKIPGGINENEGPGGQSFGVSDLDQDEYGLEDIRLRGGLDAAKAPFTYVEWGGSLFSCRL